MSDAAVTCLDSHLNSDLDPEADFVIIRHLSFMTNQNLQLLDPDLYSDGNSDMRLRRKLVTGGAFCQPRLPQSHF